MNRRRFPNFGQYLRRPYALREYCYDCAAFFDGCKAWRAAKEFECGRYDRLPDVIRGAYGQESSERPVAVTRQADAGLRNETPPPKAQAKRPKLNGPRTCECGAPLAKGKRYCDKCRDRRRRESKRRYMLPYMQNRRGSPAQPTTSQQRPLRATETPVERRTEDERTYSRTSLEMQTSVLTRAT
jgi:hypothetical protein